MTKTEKHIFKEPRKMQPEDLIFHGPFYPSSAESKALYHYEKWENKKYQFNNILLGIVFVFFTIFSIYLISELRSVWATATIIIALVCLVEFFNKEARRDAYIAGYHRGAYEAEQKSKK